MKKRKPAPLNAWMLGYRAAMRAPSIELTAAGEDAALETAHARYELGEFGVSQFRAGWSSVLRCERAHETSVDMVPGTAKVRWVGKRQPTRPYLAQITVGGTTETLSGEHTTEALALAAARGEIARRKRAQP